MSDTDPWAPVTVRWTCTCGRWIPDASVVSEDYIDPGSYWGVSSKTTGTCSRCGVVNEPRLITFAKPAAA